MKIFSTSETLALAKAATVWNPPSYRTLARWPFSKVKRTRSQSSRWMPKVKRCWNWPRISSRLYQPSLAQNTVTIPVGIIKVVKVLKDIKLRAPLPYCRNNQSTESTERHITENTVTILVGIILVTVQRLLIYFLSHTNTGVCYFLDTIH